jgi:hypothetical protein
VSQHDFRINIYPGSASFAYGEHGAEPEDPQEVSLPDDPLTRETAKLLESWLNVWDRIGASNSLHTVLKPNTFKIMGEHLWKLILDNEIGAELRKRIRQAEDPPLRVLINFDKRTSVDLRSLPWEFLCVPGSDIFLAAETNLLLTRYATPPEIIAVKRVERAIDKLGVLFVTALPPAKKYDKVRSRVHKFADQLDAEAGLDVLDPIDDLDHIEAALNDPNHPCQLVHITGVCRGEPDKPQLWIDTETGPDWQPPAKLIDSLFPRDGKSPRFVVLELSEFEEGDADENFERLAPALIERGIPAVLAMQYALADDLGPVWIKFYKDLAAGVSIGRAVQSSRYALYHGRGPNRDLGTPVLYLREDGALMQQSPALPVTELTSDHEGSPNGTVGAGAIQRWLRQTLLRDRRLYSPDQFEQGKQLMESLTRTSTVGEARDKIWSFVWRHDDELALRQLGRTLLESLAKFEQAQTRG